MSTLAYVGAPAVSIRAQTIERLTREFGAPQSGKNHERWVFKPPAPRQEVHVMVNAPTAIGRAHVLVFDPSAADGEDILEMDLRTIEEVSGLIEHIKHNVARSLKHVGATFRQPLFAISP